ncbi:MAG: WD40 repeat domain-containing protein, partial [Streptosporangiaceae bacterium]
ERTTLEGHTSGVNGVAFSPDGILLATASHDGTARIWDLTGTAPATQATLEGHGRAMRGVAFSPDGTLLATASDDETARIWDLTGTVPATRATLEGHGGAVNGVAFSPDGTLLATASDDGTARIWDVERGVVVTVLAGFPGGGRAMLTAGGYKTDGDVAGGLWWAIKMCRFEPGELDGFVPGLRRVPDGEALRLV